MHATPHITSRLEPDDAQRLIRALQSGTGHVAVICLDRETPRNHACIALFDINAVAVLHLSAAELDALNEESQHVQRVQRLLALLLEEARVVQRHAFIVIDDADEADATALEYIRAAAECAPDAIRWLRIVLIGTERLEEVLDLPAASALSSRIGTRMHVTPARGTPAALAAPRRQSFAFAATAAVSLTAVVLAASAYLSVREDVRQRMIVASNEQRPSVTTPLQTQAQLVQADVQTAQLPQSLDTSVVETLAPEDEPAVPKAEAVVPEGKAVSPEAKPESFAPEAVAPSNSETMTAPAMPTLKAESSSLDDASKNTGSEKLAKVNELVTPSPAPKEPVVKTPASPSKTPAASAKAPAVSAKRPTVSAKRPAVSAKRSAVSAKKIQSAYELAVPTKTPAVPAKTPAVSAQTPAVPANTAEGSANTLAVSATQPTLSGKTPAVAVQSAPTYRRVALQAGVFSSATRAEAARAALSKQLQGIVVVRLEGSKEPTYSVRMLDLRSVRDILDAETELHRLGYRPVRLDEPGTPDRF